MPSCPVTAPFDPTKDSPITTTTWTSLQAQSKNQRKTDTNEPGSGPKMESPRHLSLSGAWVKSLGVDVLEQRRSSCRDVRMPRRPWMAESGDLRRTWQGLFLQSLCHFLRLDNCSCIVLPSDFRVGRMEVRCASATEHKEVRERPLLALSSLRDPAALESQGLPSFVPLSCSTWKSRADRPRSARSPGKSSTGLFANLRLTHGKPAHRDESSPDFHLIPLRPWAPPFGPTFGRSNLFPTNLSLTLKQFTPPCSRKNPPA